MSNSEVLVPPTPTTRGRNFTLAVSAVCLFPRSQRGARVRPPEHRDQEQLERRGRLQRESSQTFAPAGLLEQLAVSFRRLGAEAGPRRSDGIKSTSAARALCSARGSRSARRPGRSACPTWPCGGHWWRRSEECSRVAPPLTDVRLVQAWTARSMPAPAGLTDPRRVSGSSTPWCTTAVSAQPDMWMTGILGRRDPQKGLIRMGFLRRYVRGFGYRERRRARIGSMSCPTWSVRLKSRRRSRQPSTRQPVHKSSRAWIAEPAGATWGRRLGRSIPWRSQPGRRRFSMRARRGRTESESSAAQTAA